MSAAYLQSAPIQRPRVPGCTGKVGFASRADAKQTGKERNIKYSYQCKHCGGWHVSRHDGPFAPGEFPPLVKSGAKS